MAVEANTVVFGQAAIRQGTWKAVWLPPPTGNDKWLLYDLSVGMCSTKPPRLRSLTLQDPGETTDLAATAPTKLQELVEFWHQYEAETGTVLKGPLDGAGREKMFGIKWDDWSL